MRRSSTRCARCLVTKDQKHELENETKDAKDAIKKDATKKTKLKDACRKMIENLERK